MEWDCIIVGGGPAGLTAAVYLARFRRRVAVIDANHSRARYIPESHNCPGFANGISGTDLLANLRTHAKKFGAKIIRGSVLDIARKRERFVLNDSTRRWTSRTVLIATGIVDLVPDVAGLRQGISRGIVRLCPICDGFEASGKRIAVYGPPKSVIGHAVFLRNYSDRVTVVLSEPGKISRKDAALVRKYGLSLIPVPEGMTIDSKGWLIDSGAGVERFDCLYPAMGFEPKCRLAASLGAKVDRAGEIIVSPHMETSVPGLYGAGDAVTGLHQISVAAGHAAIAATAIHRRLSDTA